MERASSFRLLVLLKSMAGAEALQVDYIYDVCEYMLVVYFCVLGGAENPMLYWLILLHLLWMHFAPLVLCFPRHSFAISKV